MGAVYGDPTGYPGGVSMPEDPYYPDLRKPDENENVVAEEEPPKGLSYAE